MKKIIIALLCLSSFLSCKKIDNSFEDAAAPITSQSTQKQIEFANKHLKQITEGIAVLAKDKDFVSFVQTEAKKKFDGEYEVLIQDLQKNSTWKQKMNMPLINIALNVFKNIDGSNYYPQIYIPKFQHEEDMKAENNYIPTNLIDSPEVVYIYYSGDSEVDSATNENDSYAGYVLDSTTNQLVYWGMVNEEYANDNEVWIISLNESVGNGGNYCPPQLINGANQYCPESVNGCCGGGNPPPPGGCNGDPNCDPTALSLTWHPDMGLHSPVNCKIDQMIVKNHKESWLAGASEVSIRAALNCHNNLELGRHRSIAGNMQYKSDQNSNYLGKLIAKFKRREVKNSTAKYVQYSLQTNWPVQSYGSDPIWFDYLIFERDIWPATKNEQPYDNMPGRKDFLNPPFSDEFSPTWHLTYRANHKNNTDWRYPYVIGGFSSNINVVFGQNQYFATGYVNNTDITFNTIGY